MKRTRVKYEPVREDGWCIVQEGNWFTWGFGEETLPGLSQAQAWIQQIRGRFLSESFGFENDLIMLILGEEFGDLGDRKPTAKYTERDLELRKNELDKKIKLAGFIARRLRGSQPGDKIVLGLSQCREIRNLMAHFACWTEPINDDERHRTVGVKLFIGNKSHIWEMEQTDVEDWAKLFLQARRDLIMLRHELLGLKKPVFGEGSIVAVGFEP